jgi:ATPase family associated with various cellular activities (AAA)
MPAWEIIAAAVAVAAGVWSHLQTVARWLASLIVQEVVTDEETALRAAAFIISQKPQRARVPAYFWAVVKPRSRGRQNISAFFENSIYCEFRTLWWGKRPIRMSSIKGDKHAHTDDGVAYRFSFIRRSLNWEELLRRAMEWEIAERDSTRHRRRAAGIKLSVRHRVIYHHGKVLQIKDDDGDKKSRSRDITYHDWASSQGKRLLHFTTDDVTGAVLTSGIKNLAIMPQVQGLIDRVRAWHNARAWFSERDLPWRLGCLISGAPGTGKTTILRELSCELDLPVHVLDIASMSNQDLREAWGEARADTPCMVVIEDVDSVFAGRDNVSKIGGLMSSGGLSFDCLLNCVDGVERADGLLLAITTNFPEKVDQALIRPGRIDVRTDFPPLDYERRLIIAKRILRDEAAAAHAALDSGDVSAAAFTEECCRLALAEHSKTGEPYR